MQDFLRLARFSCASTILARSLPQHHYLRVTSVRSSNIFLNRRLISKLYFLYTFNISRSFLHILKIYDSRIQIVLVSSQYVSQMIFIGMVLKKCKKLVVLCLLFLVTNVLWKVRRLLFWQIIDLSIVLFVLYKKYLSISFAKVIMPFTIRSGGSQTYLLYRFMSRKDLFIKQTWLDWAEKVPQTPIKLCFGHSLCSFWLEWDFTSMIVALYLWLSFQYMRKGIHMQGRTCFFISDFWHHIEESQGKT